ncbi:unnamed protein product [Adineta ricciae]|uniref:Uncharacterized protein n=1 Tax=Adineta ricciae TaxID=249248 RepID=A0A813R6J6_ADIRI|nr:unnamed protein product [Adineta ricciae]
MESMELDAMLDGEQLANNSRLRKRNAGIWQSRWVRAGVGCLFLALISLAGAITVLKLIPNTNKETTAIEKKDEIQEMVFKITLSTDHVPNNNNQPFDVKNADAIANELTSKLSGKTLRVLGGLVRNEEDSKKTSCDDTLSSHILELSLVPAFAGQSDDQSIEINVKLCQVEAVDDYRREPVATAAPSPQRPRRKRTTTTIPVEEPVALRADVPLESPVAATTKIPRAALAWRNAPARTRYNLTYKQDPYASSRKSTCALCLNRIGLVQMDGDHGSDIQDDFRSYSNNGQYHRAFILTVIEGSTHKLHLQLNCGGHLGDQSADSPCSSSLSAHVWIDFNDNEHDDSESRLLHRSWPTDGTPTGTYDLNIYIPVIDDFSTRVGPHNMIITVAPSYEYQTECGAMDYKEQRSYSVNVVRKARHPVIPQTTPYIYINPICSVDFGKIIVVLMAGEKGTEIRDDLLKNSLSNYQRNQHHLGVTLFEHTIYLLRIQLDCTSQLRTELTETGCNLAQDVNIFLDLNDDGRYESSEIGTPYRWPVTSYLPDGIYDMQLHVPYLNSQYVTSRQHPPNIYEATHVSYDNITCTPEVGKIILVVMGGEHRTQIRDDPSTNALLETSDEYQQHLSIMLREGVTYLLRLQFECGGHRYRNSPDYMCKLPHEVSAWVDLNDDGHYDEPESATPYRWPLTSYLPQGIYDLQIVVPIIDDRKIKSGPHRMKLVVTLNEQYRRKCNIYDYQETKFYTVTIVSHTATSSELGGPYLRLSDRVCSQSHGRIVLVIMAENTNYRIRIQLDCELISSRGPLRSDCNLAQDVNILIDQNNDNKFDEFETVTPHR